MIEMWKNLIEHVQKKERNIWNLNCQCEEFLKNFIVNLGDDSFSDFPTSNEALYDVEAL